jgi:Protein of unknown function (DUF3592)
VKSKLGAALFCLLFAIPFGGVGVGASWVLGRMIYDGHRAEDWVRVKAIVDSFGNGSVVYHYAYGGKNYGGDRLGANPIGGTDNVDSWHEDMAAMLSEAQRDGKPITVWVNPDNPAESMVDRTIRWKLGVFIIPFALGFGGAGVGALVVFFRTLFRPAEDVKRDPIGTPSTASGGVFMIWVFAFFWNAISVPIAVLVVPEGIQSGEWAVLLVLIFPLIGLLLIWGAIASTIAAIKRKFGREPVPQPAAVSRPANDGVFARGLIDSPSAPSAAGAIDTMDDGMPGAPDPMMTELEKLSGRKLSAEQREQLEKMDPKSRAVVTKMAGWLGKIKQTQD